MLSDLHCHMLPGIDDGSKDMEQSLAMARIAVADGISTTVVTPHHLNGVYSNPARQIRAGIEALNEALERAGIGLALLREALPPGARIPAWLRSSVQSRASTRSRRSCRAPRRTGR
ncbi:MAG: hypothetical protein KGY48_09450 [Wenzhouxiangellaceae bacterium]|nr:hypothetical protein [Wenzhouxiangellaceae bacterium]